jgi:hypothetical protein
MYLTPCPKKVYFAHPMRHAQMLSIPYLSTTYSSHHPQTRVFIHPFILNAPQTAPY